MPTYDVTVEGSDYEVDAPDENTAWQWAYMTHQQRPAPSKARTMGEAVTDIGAQLKGGLGKLAQFPGQLYGLATGDFSDTGLYGYGKEMEANAEAAKSAGLKAREAARAQAIAEAEKTGQISAGITAAKETITDPALLLGVLAENVPSMIIPAGAAAGVGRAALQKGLAKGVEAAAAREAAIAAGSKAAIRTAAVQQGADVGTGAYEEVYKRLVSQGMSEPEAAAEAINRARAAGVAGGVISLLAQRLPGAKKLEEVLAGRTTGAGLGRAALSGAAGEALGETAEEVGGKLAQNVALRTVDPTQSLTAGLGETAGMAALAGAGLGGLGGGVSAMRGTPEAAGTADAARQQAQQRILEARERERVKAEGEQPIGAMGPYAQQQYGELEREKQQLLQGPQAPNVKERLAEITQQQKQLNIAEITRVREETKQQEIEAKKAAASAFSQPEVRETPEGQGELFSQFEAPQARVQPETLPTPAAREAQPLAPSTLEKYGQGRLGLRGGKEGEGLYKAEAPKAEAGITGTTQAAIEPLEPIAPVQPVSEVVPEPTLAPKRVVPPELQPIIDSLTAAGVRPETKTWAENGRNRPFLRKLVSMSVMAPEARQAARKALKLEEGSHKAEAFDALFPAPRVPAFEPAAGAGKPSVGIPSKPRPVAPAEPTATGAGETVGRGVVPTGGAAPTPAAPEIGAKPALEEPTPKKVSLKEAEAAWEENNVEGAGTRLAFKDLSSDRKKIWKDSVEDGTATIEEYERLAKDQADIVKAEKRKAAATEEAKRATEEAEAAEKKAQLAAQIREREQAKRDKAEAKRKEEERVKAEREAEAKAKAEAAAARERAKRETEETPKPKKGLTREKAEELLSDLDIDPDTTKSKVKALAKRMRDAGLIDDNDVNALERISKDRDMGAEDLLDELRSSLAATEVVVKRKAEEASKQLKALVERMDAEQAAREAEAKRKVKETEAKRKAEEADAKRRAEEAEAKRKAKEAEEAEAQRNLEALPPYEERVKLSADDLYPKLKDFDSAVSAVYEQSSNPAERTIASLIKSRVEQFKKLGFDFSLRVTPEGKMLSSGALGHSHIQYSHIGEATKVAVALNHPSNGELSGTSWRIVTHELLHAVTQAQIKFAPEGATAKKLKALFNDVVEHFNARAKAKTLTAFETRIYNGEINALQNPDELLTWGLTDRDMQAWLNGIESKKGNFLSRLYDVVASVLGFSKPNTALAELLSVSETLLTEPTDTYVKSANLSGASFGLQENVSDVPNWALGFAEGLPVVWFEKDAALIKSESVTGKTIYILATPKGVSRTDVASYTGDLLPAARLAEVRAIADTFRAAPEKETMAMRAAPSPTEGIAETSELMKEAPGEFKTAVKDFTRIFTEKDDVSYVTRFRTETTDSMASVVNRTNILFDGKVRDELTGLNNPEQLMRQAEDPSALFTAVMSKGGLEKDPTSGRYVATDKAGPGGSIADMLAAVKNWSDANGMDFNLAYAEASKMIEARRLDAMRQANEQIKEAAKKAGVKAELFPIHKLSQKDKYDRTADEQIDAALRGLKANPEIQAVADMMDKQRAYMIDHMVAVGRISKETSQEWKDAAGYVPFDRVEDFFNKYVPRRTTGRGITQLGSLPKYVGSTQREVGNVINNHVKLMGWMLTQTLKQDAGSTTLNLLADMGQARRLHGDKLAANNAGNVVKSYKNGREEYFEVRSRYDVKAFIEAPESKLAIFKLFTQVSNILRKIVTVMPPFIAKQVTDDIQRGFLTSGVKSPSRLIIPAVTNFLRIAGHEVVFGKDHPFTKEFAKKGLGGNIDYNPNNPAETVLFSLGYSKRGWLRELHHRLESITRASDLAMRKAIYDRTMVEENNDVALATARAQEFINFRRRGANQTIKLGVATIPFFNAYLQANDLLLRSMVGRGSSHTEKAVARRLFWMQAAKMTGFALIYALANSDDDEYKKQTLADRSNNWIIGGKKLPVPGDMAALFKVPVEALVQYMARQGTKDEQLTGEVVQQVLGYAFEQFVGRVTPVPQAIRPVAEAVMNHSLLTGRELVGTYQQGMPKPLQATTTTSELAKAIAEFAFNNIKDPVTDTPLQLSPVIIDNTLRGYLGGVVPLTNMLTDQLLNPNKTDRPLSKYWFLSQYLTPEVPTGPKEEFYDLVNKVMPAKRALDDLMKTDMEKAAKYYEKNKDNLLMAELVNKALQEIEQTRAYIKYLDSANGAKAIPSSAERLKMKQEVERYENKNLEWVRSAKAQIFGKKG